MSVGSGNLSSGSQEGPAGLAPTSSTDCVSGAFLATIHMRIPRVRHSYCFIDIPWRVSVYIVYADEIPLCRQHLERRQRDGCKKDSSDFIVDFYDGAICLMGWIWFVHTT